MASTITEVGPCKKLVKVSIAKDRVKEKLEQNLRELSQQIQPIPELHLQPEPDARYELVDQVLAITKRAHVEKMGFVGNEAYMKF